MLPAAQLKGDQSVCLSLLTITTPTAPGHREPWFSTSEKIIRLTGYGSCFMRTLRPGSGDTMEACDNRMLYCSAVQSSVDEFRSRTLA
jgi:hypothetical protein